MSPVLVRDRLDAADVDSIVGSVTARAEAIGGWRSTTTSTWTAEALADRLCPVLSRPVAENPLHAVWALIAGNPDKRDSFQRCFAADVDVPEETVTFELRRELARRVAWAVPDDRALATIERHSPGGVVEVMAGLGYWARLLRQRGVDVVASDLGDSPYLAGDPWTDVAIGDAAEAAARHPGRTLLICWPPMSGDAARAVRAYHAAGGRTVIYIGEGEGGCTGDSDLHQSLGLTDEPGAEALFTPVDDVGIPQWWGIHDHLWVCGRPT